MKNHCRNCGLDNRMGVLFCEECGHSLFSQTNELVTVETGGRDMREALNKKLKASGRKRQQGIKAMMLYVGDTETPITIRPSDERITIGRLVEAEPVKPDIDLTPYGALEKGVSRIHAVIQCMSDGVTITDLNSTNGISINNRSIKPHVEHHLSDGDIIHMGQLDLQVYFE